MACKQKSKHDPQRGVCCWFKFLESVHLIPLIRKLSGADYNNADRQQPSPRKYHVKKKPVAGDNGLITVSK
jgi:hypothetical protein